MLNLEDFINKYVIRRNESLFNPDLTRYKEQLSDFIENRKFLVIGGAGSIGSSFIKTILPYKPAAVVVVDTNENALAELVRDIRCTRSLFVPKRFITYPMSYASDAFYRMFRSEKRFDVVANFSAHKHVRSEKDVISSESILQNNVIDARRLLDFMVLHPPVTYFCVSTDKAANPVNVMGASKRIMEDLIFAYSDSFAVKTARFANVAFSNGSLPESFLKRISKLQPLSAPSDVKRFFVSPKESGQICMLACALGGNREIFFPKLDNASMMGFDEIAVALLHEYGFTPRLCSSDGEALDFAEHLREGIKDYPVHFGISDTSGEKMYEEFYTPSESVQLNRFDSLGVIRKDKPDREKLDFFINDLEMLFKQEDVRKEDIVNRIETYLPEFKHIETGHSLDEKM